MHDKAFILMQLFTDQRSQETFGTQFGEYVSLAEAKREAKKLKLKRWAIVAQTVVARSAEEVTA